LFSQMLDARIGHDEAARCCRSCPDDERANHKSTPRNIAIRLDTGDTAHMEKTILEYLKAASAGDWALGIGLGFLAWFIVRYGILGFYTVDQNERAVITSFGRAQRLTGATTVVTPEGTKMSPSEKERYVWPQVRVVPPGGPYFRWPWQRVHKVSIATRTVNMAWDPEEPAANRGGTQIEAVTKDHLNVGLRGQVRFRVSEQNLYAYLFGVKNPPSHVMGFFVSILRERIANFEAPKPKTEAAPPAQSPLSLGDQGIGVSINDLRKNLRNLNDAMDKECASSVARYGVHFDASLITEIDPPEEVESALAAINTAHNQVSSDISLAQASADQRIVQSKRAVEIETLRAQAEVEPLRALAKQLKDLMAQGGDAAIEAYVRNVKLGLLSKADRVYLEGRP
jgi:regulator of protease activity HflC (stomatin/prohibitin superfamily)